MSFKFHKHEVDPIVHDIILAKAKNMVGNGGNANHEIDDLVQYIYCKLLDRFPLDPHNSPRGALLEIAIDRLLSNYRRDKEALKRRPPAICSLSIVVDLDDEGHPVDLAATITAKEQAARLGISVRTDREDIERKLDVAAVIKQLCPEDADLCERLKYDRPAQVARDLGVPRSTLDDRIRRLIEPFVAAGLSKLI